MAVLFFLHPWLGFLSLVFALIQAALAWFGHRHTHEPTEQANRAINESQAFLHSKLRNAELLESMGMLGNIRRRWGVRHTGALHAAEQSNALTHRITAISKFIRYSQQSLVLAAGALLVIDGQLSPGGMIAANVLTGKALAPIDQIVSSWRSFIACRVAFDRLEGLLREFPERDPALGRTAPRGAITLRNVFASAPGRESPILKKINVDLPLNAVVVVLGASGSGKSTLARVIVGIWPDVSGEVLLDQMPLANWDRMELGPHIGYLPQDIELFDGTIADNISRFADQDSAKVISAARSAGLHEMILRFPKGYDTEIGEAGSMLSGGQRQRIGLARALYGEPALVVLDEPNANLDDAGEQALLQAVLELKAKGKTVVLITHRPGAVTAADFLLLMKEGEIMACGPKDTVLRALQRTDVPTTAPGAPPAVDAPAIPT